MSKRQQQTNSEGRFLRIQMENEDLASNRGGLFDQTGILQSKIANDNGITYNSTTTHSLALGGPEGIVIEVLPSLGGRSGTKRAQLAFKDQLVAVVGSAYSSINCSEADLMKLAMYCQGLGGLIEEIDVALAMIDACSPLNAAFTKRLVYLKGWSFDDVLAHKKQLRDYRNRLAELVNTKFYLGKNSATDRLYYLLGNVFIDDFSEKGQPIIFTCPLYVDISDITGQVHPDGVINYAANGLNNRLTFAFVETVVRNAEQFALSLWYNDVAPYLFHIYGDKREGLYHFEMLNDYPKLTITCNPVIMEVIRNVRVFGQVIDWLSDLSQFDIWEDNLGYIHQGGLTSNPGELTTITSYVVGYNDTAKAKLLDSPNLIINLEEYPGKSSEILSIMELSHQCGVVNPGGAAVAFTGNPDHYRALEYSGSILILGIYKAHWNNGIYSLSTFRCAFKNGGGPGSFVFASFATDSSTPALISTLKERQVSVAPNIMWWEYSFVQNTNWTTYYPSEISVKDRDNIIVIPYSAHVDFLIQQCYDMWHFSAPSYSGGSYKKSGNRPESNNNK